MSEIQDQLGECLLALRRETSFRAVLPGGSVPMMRYEVVEAKDSVEKAIKALEEDDMALMLEHVKNAVAQLITED